MRAKSCPPIALSKDIGQRQVCKRCKCMTPARLERATFGLGTPGTGSQAFPPLPCSLESGEIRLNPPGCFPCLSLPFPTVIQSTSKVGGVSERLSQ